MATSDFKITEGAGINIATYSITEDAITKELQRIVLSDSSGNELTANIGAVTETAPTTDTASSGLNGRLQRLAQRITSLIALLPTALGAGGGLKVDGSGTALPVSLSSVPSHAVTNAGTFAVQATDSGDVAHDSADSGNPVKIGAKASNAEPAAVANGDRANLYTDLAGRLISLPYSTPEYMVSGATTTAMTGTTSTSLIAAPGAGLRNYITTIIVSNAHASVGTDVIIQDGSGGTTLLTIPAAAIYGGAVINLPVPLRQPTANTALYCANVTTGASTKVSAVGYKGA